MLKKPILNTLVQIGGKVVMVLLSLVITAILTRKLGIEVYGRYALITAVFILLDSLADFGTKVIGVREASKLEKEERKNVFIQSAWLRLITSLLAFVLGLLLIFLWKGFDLIRWEALIALTMIFFTSIGGSLEIIFQTEQRMELKVGMDILFPLIFLVTLWLWPGLISLIWVFSVYLIARILSLLLGIGMAKNLVGKIKTVALDKKYLKKFIKEAWPMGLYLIIFTGYDRAVDALMIERMIGIKEVAFYALAYKIYGNLIQPVYFFINSIFPIMSRKNDDKKFLTRSFFLILGALVIILPTVYLLAPWIIRVLTGEGFGQSVIVLRILLIALFFAYLNHLVGFKLISLGGQKKILYLGLIALTFNLVGNLILIPKLGIVGAAWITGMTEMLMFVLTALMLRERLAASE